MTIYRWLNREKSRYYTIAIQQNDSSISMYYAWGGINSNRGGTKNIFVESIEEAQKHIMHMIKRRKSRGYELLSS